MLKRKAKCNYYVARYAEENKHFDAAVSRYYYYLYESILFYLHYNRLAHLIDKNNHAKTIDNFIDILKFRSVITDTEMYYLMNLKILRTKRNNADYHQTISISDEEAFDTQFKNMFIRINQLLVSKNLTEEITWNI